MESQETEEQKIIRELTAENDSLKEESENLRFINIKLGYSTKILSEYHLTFDDKIKIANSLDLATQPKEVVKVYNEYKKIIHNKALDKEGLEEFQMSDDFKENLTSYISVYFGEDPFQSLVTNIKIVKDYFDFENKIRSTPDGNQRNAMTEKLLASRPSVIEAMNNLINTINALTKSDKHQNS